MTLCHGSPCAAAARSSSRSHPNGPAGTQRRPQDHDRGRLRRPAPPLALARLLKCPRQDGLSG
eukprot:scaffold18659_cov58-Phaeocystis_antarctica.AAC.2